MQAGRLHHKSIVMEPNQLGFTLILSAVLVALAVYFGRQQVLTLRALGSLGAVNRDERHYLRSQAYRRLVCSVLMVAIAGLLIGWLFIQAQHEELQKELRIAQAENPEAMPTEEHRNFANWFRVYLSTALLVLLLLLVLATMDFWATARYGLTQHRKLLADRKAMFDEEMNRKRQERNGQQGGHKV
jgi:phosphatidylglycerophosphate synthase